MIIQQTNTLKKIGYGELIENNYKLTMIEFWKEETNG